MKRKHVECSSGSNKPEADLYFIVPDKYPEPACWVEAFSLYKNDRKVLLGEQELTDNIMNASQFPRIAGLQDTVLGRRNLNFKPVGHDTSSVQILHTGIYMYCHVHVLLLKPVIITL